MKNKTYLKIALDIIMCIVLLLLYNKRVISMKYHEVSGLIVIGLFILHKGLNFNWIKSVSKKIFKGNLPIKTRIGFIINLLLLVFMTLVAVSGILISKTILTGISSSNGIWKMIHMSSAAFALILVGIHLGLHWTYIKGVSKKFINIPSSIGKPLGIVIMAAILIFGTYSIFTSSFSRWVSMPINLVSSSNTQGGNEQGLKEHQNGNKPGEGQQKEQGKRDGQGQGQNKGQGTGVQQISITNIFNVILTFLSITLVFAVITYNIERSLINRRKKLA